MLKYGIWCLFALTSASAVLAVIDMLHPGLNSQIPIIIQSLFTYGFYLWALLTVGALILDFYSNRKARFSFNSIQRICSSGIMSRFYSRLKTVLFSIMTVLLYTR